MTKLQSLAAALLLAASAGSASAFSLVDTGAVSTPIGSLSLDGTDWLAGEITLTQTVTLTSVKAWLGDQTGGGSFTVSLYDNDPSNGPDLPGNVLAQANASMAPAAGVYGWYGASNLNWTEGPGKYWVAFEVIGAQTVANGAAPVLAPHPLSAYAYNDGGATPSASGYKPMAGATNAFAVQVDAIPEPETYALLLAGLGVVALSTRRRQAA